MWRRYLRDRRREVAWLAIFFGVTAIIFVERYWRYTNQRLHGGLRGITGPGVAVTRGAASAMMWCFSICLVPLCRHILTAMRTTSLRRVIPFDSALSFHKVAASTGGLFAIVHLVGHAFNFYKVATQPAQDLACLFREVYWYTHQLPSFAYWLFHTVTGFTGVLLVLVMAVMFAFAGPWARRWDFQVFHLTHMLYIPFYFLLLAHGAARLVQQPIFWQYMLGPLLLLVIDRLWALAVATPRLRVLQADLLPGDVLHLRLTRPRRFDPASGQWVRLRCAMVSKREWHPFTLSSAPHEPHIDVHVRAVGPWTRKLREVYRAALDQGLPLPLMQLQGPYGEGYQGWSEAETAVLIGAGIGITPFVSILKDFGWRLRQQRRVEAALGAERSDGDDGSTAAQAAAADVNVKAMRTQHLYFLWVARSQRQFEWVRDVIREVEELDTEGRLEAHLFCTAPPGQTDFPTAVATALDEEHHARTGVSLLTGLRAARHTGRPDFLALLSQLREQHPTGRLQVYSCGPSALAEDLDAARATVNMRLGTSQYIRHMHTRFYT